MELHNESIDEARRLSTQVAALYGQGNYVQAIPLAQRALEIEERLLGPQTSGVASDLSDLASLYLATGAYAKAEPLFVRALSIYEKDLGPEHPHTAVLLNNLAEMYRTIGAYGKAEPLYRRALAIYESTVGPESPDTATALNNLATLYLATGAYSPAESMFRRALLIFEKAFGSDAPNLATVLNNLASLYLATGAYDKAGSLYLRALANYEKALGPSQPATSIALNNLAELYRTVGAYAKAEPLYERALAIRENALGPNHPATAVTLRNLGHLCRNTGAYERAGQLYQRALEIDERAFGPDHRDTARALESLAGLHLARAAYAKAESLYQRALPIYEKAFGREHPETEKALSNLAILYLAQGSYPKAEALYEQALVIGDKNTTRFLLSGSEARKQSYVLQNVGHAYVCVSQSVAHPTARSIALGLTSVLQYKGRVLDAMTDNVARLRHNVAPEDRSLFDELADVAQEFSTLTFRGPGALSALAYLERLDALAQQQERLQAELSTRSAALRQAVVPVTLEGVRQALPADAVLVEFLRYVPFDPKAGDSTRWGAPRYVAYVLARGGEPVAVDLGAAQPIDDLVAEWRTALSDPASTGFGEVAEQLCEMLVEPLRPHLARRERLLLSPDGALNLVPFAALVDGRGDYLLQHFELTYLTSGRDLLRMATESPPRAGAVVLADPDYGQAPGGGPPVDAGLQPKRAAELDRSGLVFTPLPGTAAEATSLQALLKLDALNVLIGDRATEARLRELHGPRILHMATHGFFLNDLQMKAVLRRAGLGIETAQLPLDENPLLRSGLALAGANARLSGATDDGILTAAEAAQLDLFGTQLVVLSACETGMGTVQTGEGVYGLRRALVLAGAQSQVVSLWKVNDAAAQELMVDYYQRLLQGEGRSGALRAAQQAMLADPARRHPCYWAAFIPVGDWTPLQIEAYAD